MKKLIICGTGIKYVSHVTHEAIQHIKQSDKVLYLVNEPLTKEWIHEQNINSEDMDTIYNSFELRSDSYKNISNHIIQTIGQFNTVCVVLYGHPTICANPALDAVNKAKLMGVDIEVLPAVSSDATLYSDLMLDPLANGMQSYEATYFLNKRPTYYPYANLLLWQISNINLQTHDRNVNRNGIIKLRNILLDVYGGEHVVTIYEASLYPSIDPVILKITLDKLDEGEFSPISTLYIPPIVRHG